MTEVTTKSVIETNYITEQIMLDKEDSDAIFVVAILVVIGLIAFLIVCLYLKRRCMKGR